MQQVQDRTVDVLGSGAGLAGLVAGATAARAGMTVAVLDSRSPGGRARSDERDGYILNQGPRALYLRGPGAAVLADLGIRPEGTPPATKVFGWRSDKNGLGWRSDTIGVGGRSGTIGLLPTSAGALVRSPLIGWHAKVKLARMLATFGRLDPESLASLSTSSWVDSVGLPDDGAAVLRTLLRVATYASDLELISADAAVRQLQLVQIGGVSYLHGGWSRLVDELVSAARSAGATIIEGERALGVVAQSPRGPWEVRTASGCWLAGAVVIAAGGPASARGLLPSAPNWNLGQDSTAACLDLGLRRPPPRRVVFGLEAPLYFSTHSPAAELAPPGAAMVHVMRYGARSSEEDRTQLWAFARVAGVRDDDVVVERFLHKMVVSHSLPRPGAGLAGRPSVAIDDQPGLFVAGDWVGGHGLLADASLSSGSAAGQAAAAAAGAAAGDSASVAPQRLVG